MTATTLFLVGGGGEKRLTCRHDARGGDGQHGDVLAAVRRVQVGGAGGWPAAICLASRRGDGEQRRLVVRRREGGVLFLLFFHFVQEDGILQLRARRHTTTLRPFLGQVTHEDNRAVFVPILRLPDQ